MEQSALLDNKKNLPATFKMGRSVANKAGSIEHSIYESMASSEISEYDLACYSFALAQALYNQSYQCGNTDFNSGNERIRAKIGGYEGHIFITRNDLCRYAFGVINPSFKERKKMDNIVNVVHCTPVDIKIRGKVNKVCLCSLKSPIITDNGAVAYHLVMHPLFCQDVPKNFAELPQDIMQRLSKAVKRKTTAHIRMLRLLACQDKDNPLSRTIPVLLEYLGLVEAYQINKKRTIKQIKNCLDAMKEIGILSGYLSEGDKITCIFNEFFLRKYTRENREENK